MKVIWAPLAEQQVAAIPLADAYLAAYALVRGAPWGDPGLPAVASFDRHFDNLDGLRRIGEPPEAS